MATSKLLLIFISIAFTVISSQETDAKNLAYKRKLQFNPPPLKLLPRDTQAVTKPRSFIYHATRKITSAYGSFAVVKFGIDGDGVPTAMAPTISYSSQRESPLKAVFVILVLVLISSALATFVKIICGRRVEPNSELRQIAEAARNSELTLCQCNATFTLFPFPL